MIRKNTFEVESFEYDKSTHYQCFKGVPFYPFDPMRSLDCITVDNIANVLSRTCRFNGRTRRFYSVAEHSLYVARRVPTELELYGLLHDAHEAFTGFGDVPTPVKPEFLSDMEGEIDVAIAAKFGFKDECLWLPQIAEADAFMCAQERHFLLDPSDESVEWGEIASIPPDVNYENLIHPMSAGEVCESFKTKLRHLLTNHRKRR